MATINYIIRGKSNPASIHLRFKHGRKIDLTKNTGFIINQLDWNSKKKSPKQNTPENKNLSVELNQLSNSIIKEFNTTNIDEINGEWLLYQIKLFKKEIKPNQKRSDLITSCISHIIETANIRENSKNGLGLSNSRIKSYSNLRKIIINFQKGKKPLRVKDVDLSLAKEFLNWLINKQNYSESYSRKKIDDLKTVCRDAETDGIEVSPQLNRIKGGKPKNEHIIYLSTKELEKIEKAHIVSTALQNARKWLLFGCHIGQRGSDLLAITESNFVKHQGLEVIELKQQKTDKDVTIPILDRTKEILKDGLPKKISIQKLNTYFKDVCRLSGIDQPVNGSKILIVDENGKEIPKDEKGKYIKKGYKRTVIGSYPKYELISTHVCRRSFATNLYGTLPTSMIMQITAHSTEKMLLQYIGKNKLDYAQQIADFYELQKLKKDKEAPLKIIKNSSSNF